MEQFNYGNVRLGIVDTGRQMLSALKQALQGFGFRDLLATQNFEDLEGALETDSLDVVICDAELEGGDIGDLVRRVRRGEVGKNPFVKFLIMLSSSDTNEVHKMIDCGVDDLLVKPITAIDLSRRLDRLTEDRRPYVVTFDYIGPDRRSKLRPGTQDIPKIDVPNALQLKTKSDFRQHLLTKQILEAQKQINLQIIERQAHQVSYRADKAIEAASAGNSISHEQSMNLHLGQLIIVAEKLLPLLAESIYAQEDITINTTVDMARRISNSQKPNSDDIVQLEKMSKLIRKSFGAAQLVAA